jgi:programmed cell death protein 5
MDGIDADGIAKMQQIEAMKKQILGRILTKEAFERLGRVRFANPELASQAEMYILQVYQTGNLKEGVTDEQMKDVLRALSEKREFRVKRE